MYKNLIQIDWDHYQDSDEEDTGMNVPFSGDFERMMQSYQHDDHHCDSCSSCESSEEEEEGEDMPPLESTECCVCCHKQFKSASYCQFLSKCHPASLHHGVPYKSIPLPSLSLHRGEVHKVLIVLQSLFGKLLIALNRFWVVLPGFLLFVHMAKLFLRVVLHGAGR